MGQHTHTAMLLPQYTIVRIDSLGAVLLLYDTPYDTSYNMWQHSSWILSHHTPARAQSEPITATKHTHEVRNFEELDRCCVQSSPPHYHCTTSRTHARLLFSVDRFRKKRLVFGFWFLVRVTDESKNSMMQQHSQQSSSPTHNEPEYFEVDSLRV